MIQSDNTTAISCVKKWGSTSSTFRDRLTQKIRKLAIELNCQLSITHIRGVDNVKADRSSRKLTETTEWQLDPIAFACLKRRFSDINADIFASHLNRKCDTFFTYHPLPGATGVDCFCFDWNDFTGYAFPPFNIIHKCMLHVETYTVNKVYFVLPWFPSAPWFTHMVELLIDNPILLPSAVTKSLRLPWDPDRMHPLHRHLRLIWVTLSGQRWQNQSFRDKCKRSYQTTNGNLTPHANTNISYKPGSPIVHNTTYIHVTCPSNIFWKL